MIFLTGDNLKKSISTFLSRSVGHTVTVQSVLIAEWKDMVQYHSIDDKVCSQYLLNWFDEFVCLV